LRVTDGLLDSLSASGNKAYYGLRSLPGGELPPERRVPSAAIAAIL
jgi:hypothetical protein